MLKKTTIGGQAVFEGIMMKNVDKYAIAVRKPDQSIEVKTEEYEAVGEKIKILKLPIIRGVFNFIESMIIGFKTLSYSTSFYEDEEDNKKPKKEKSKKDSKKENATIDEKVTDQEKEKNKEKEDGITTFFTVMLSIVIAIGIFMVLPAFLTGLLSNIIKNQLIVVILEGVLRLIIFLGYVIVISQMSEIKRMFMYHGAEHKTINCLEAGDALTVNNIRKHSRFHKRCGTSFIFVVIIVSIIVFMFISVDNSILRIVYRILLVPVIAGVSYEFVRFAGKSDSKIMTILSIPGMWVQRLTTKEPDDSMIEVAIASVEGVIDWEEYIKQLNNGELEG